MIEKSSTDNTLLPMEQGPNLRDFNSFGNNKPFTQRPQDKSPREQCPNLQAFNGDEPATQRPQDQFIKRKPFKFCAKSDTQHYEEMSRNTIDQYSSDDGFLPMDPNPRVYNDNELSSQRPQNQNQVRKPFQFCAKSDNQDCREVPVGT